MYSFLMSSEPKNSNKERLLALVACLLITFCMGTVHAFSTLIQNIEIQTGVDRMESSLVYYIALVNVTLAVFFGHILYRKFSPNLLILLITILPIIGLFFLKFAELAWLDSWLRLSFWYLQWSRLWPLTLYRFIHN